ncbi:YihY/virulence factor BrkB family protein [uncultured Tateyamaria sp.]|uniref:YihY/virulence factor BrkB family protein n=1 Tax=uncultured Tateyamaria sp. TaxID=455651 RepID=UPI002612A158|nr:YihY/virulence factor BrkB family protein [uncultured Tateyamaria sp.]
MSRGRNAHTPRNITGKGWLDVAARVWSGIGDLHLGLLAAGVAFYGLLSLFPAISAGVAITGIVYDPASLVDQAGWLLNMLPQAARDVITGQLSEVSGAGQGALGLAAIVSIALALWSASSATGSLVEGLTLIYEEEDTRGFLKSKVLVIGLTLAILLGLVVMVVVVAAIPAVLTFVGAGQGLIDTALMLRWPIMFALGVLGIAFLYRHGPDRRAPRWRWVTPGAALSCVLWVAGTFGFSVYVQSFASYNETFGALAGVIILMTWLWLSAFVVLLGALLDAELEAQTARDTTVGPDRPMGERGAVKADTLGARRDQNDGADAEQVGATAR